MREQRHRVLRLRREQAAGTLLSIMLITYRIPSINMNVVRQLIMNIYWLNIWRDAIWNVLPSTAGMLHNLRSHNNRFV